MNTTVHRNDDDMALVGKRDSDDEEHDGEQDEYLVVEQNQMTMTPTEAKCDLQWSHANSVVERIKKNRLNEYMDQLKARAQELIPKSERLKASPSQLIVDRLSLEDLNVIKKTFQASNFTEDEQNIEKVLSKDQLRSRLESLCKIVFPDDRWDLTFIKMDVHSRGYVHYDEFVNYLLLEFRIKENLEDDIALWMLEDPVQDLPTFIRSHHRHTIIDITFSALVKRQKGMRRASFANGKYLTVSEQGTINTWSLNMELENTQECPSPVLRSTKTCVLKAVALPDINLLAVSSTERDLRFYDITGRHYQLKTRIYKLPHPATALHYHFQENVEEDSMLIFGDSEGSIFVLKFTSKQGGPLKKFEQTNKCPYQCITFDSLVKDAHIERSLSMVAFKNVHVGAWVMKILYSHDLWVGKQLIVSCANSHNCSMAVIDIVEMKILKKFKVNKGVNTFCAVEGMEQLITGGFDTTIRLWHVKAPKKRIASMSGHYAPIDAIYEQHNGARVFSISRDRVIKIWDTREMVCIQTCTNKLQEIGESTMVIFYNPFYRQCILAGDNIAYFKLGSDVNKFVSDGYTHVGGVTKAMYNSLFKVIVTVGMDSNIMSWNPWKGKMIFVVRKAHTKHVLGENKPLGITSATFSPSQVYLLTGSLDGSIKMWNFTIGTCLRTMYIEEDCVVTGLVWVPGRIIAAGWNMHISEWEDRIDQGDCKMWATVHSKDILTLVQCGPKAIVSASYNGELVFYNLQNGHHYNRFLVGKPYLPLTMGFVAALQGPVEAKEPLKEKEEAGSLFSFSSSSSSSDESFGRPIGVRKHPVLSIDGEESSGAPQMKYQRKESGWSCDCVLPCPCEPPELRGYSGQGRTEVHSLLFLDSRLDHPSVGTLLAALQTGNVQLWSHNPKGGLVDTFYAVHIIGDYVTSMASDVKNEFLFTGTRFGYVKIWHIVNYCVLPTMKVHRCLPQLRLDFPFLMNDRLPGRAKRAVKNQPEPLLCSSCRNHLDRVMHIELFGDNKIYITAGLDRTVRMWLFSGIYVGVLGGVNPWNFPDVRETNPGPPYKIPADLTRVLSSTSINVLTARNKAWVKNPKGEQEDDNLENRLMEYRYTELDEVFRGICSFPEDDSKYHIDPSDTTEGGEIRKAIKEPVLRVLNMLKTVGQYDMRPPKADRLVRNIRQLLEDQDKKFARGRPTLQGQPTRTRPKERRVERLTSYQKLWRQTEPSPDLYDARPSDQVRPAKSGSSLQTASSIASSKSLELSTDAKNLEVLLKSFEESAKGWSKQI